MIVTPETISGDLGTRRGTQTAAPTQTPRRIGGENRIQPFRRTPRTPKTPGKGTGMGFSASNLRSSPTAPTPSVSPPSSPANSGKPPGRKLPSTRGVTLGLGVNAKGDLDFGLGFKGVGATISSRGDVSLGLGVASVTWNFKNPNESALGFGFNSLTIEGKQEGCTVILSYKVLGAIVNQETRRADECGGGEAPDPGHESNTSNPGQGDNPNPGNPGSQGQSTTRSTRTTSYNFPERVNILVGKESAKTPVRDSYFSDGFGNYTPLNNYTSSQQVPERVLSASSFEIIETIIKDRFPFYTTENAKNRGTGMDISGVVYVETIYFDLRLPNGSIRGLGLELNSRIIFNSYRTPTDPYRLTVQHNPTGTGSTGFNVDSGIYGLNPLKNRNIIEEYVPYFFHEYQQRLIIQFTPTKPKIGSNYTSKPRGLAMPEDEDICYRIYEMLGGDQFYDNGLTIPNEIFTPEGEGSTRLWTYHDINNVLFRTLDHRTPGQVEFSLLDVNKAKAGNQEFNYKSINATGYFADLYKTITESKNENTDQLQILVRLGFITTQIMKMAVIISEAIKSLFAFFNVPIKEEVEQVEVPFDLTLGNKLQKGFDNRQDLEKELLKVLDEDTEEAAEGILSKLLNTGNMKVRVRRIRQGGKEGGDFWFFLRNGINFKK